MAKNAHDTEVDAIIAQVLSAGPFSGSEADLITEAIKQASDVAYHNGFIDGQTNPIENADPLLAGGTRDRYAIILLGDGGRRFTLAKHPDFKAAKKDADLMRLAMTDPSKIKVEMLKQ